MLILATTFANESLKSVDVKDKDNNLQETICFDIHRQVCEWFWCDRNKINVVVKEYVIEEL